MQLTNKGFIKLNYIIMLIQLLDTCFIMQVAGYDLK